MRAVRLDASSPASASVTLEAQAGLWSDAVVVGVGSTARTVRELHFIAHGLVRLMVERLAFRSVLVEGDREASEALDGFVRDGTGDPRAILTQARPFLATEELLDLVRWLRLHNDRDPANLVRIVHGGVDDLSSPAALEQSLAEQVTSWHDELGDRIICLGGVAHTAVATERVTAPGPTGPVRSAGALLRDRFGARYGSIGMTFGSGAIPQPVPLPTPTSLEAHLDELRYPTALVVSHDLRDDPEGTVRADRIRLVGPTYDPRDDPDHSMVGDPTSWFDVVIHQRLATSVNFLS